MNTMKKGFTLLILFCVMSLISFGATCAQSASYATFMSVGSCTVGNIELSNFGLVSTANPTGSAIQASSITLTLNTGTAGQLGMTFNTGMSATGAGNFQDLNFSFDLTGLNNLVMFIGDSLTFNGSATGGASTGVSSVVCTSGPTTTCPSGDTYLAQVFNPPPILGDTMSFPGAFKIWANKDAVVSGADGGTGQISSITNTYLYETTSDVPEPGAMFLIGGGLAAFALFRRRSGA